MGAAGSINFGEENNVDDEELDKPILRAPIEGYGAGSGNEVLQMQAAAHWHRILTHTKNQMDTNDGKVSFGAPQANGSLSMNPQSSSPAVVQITKDSKEIADILHRPEAKKKRSVDAVTQMGVDMARQEREDAKAGKRKHHHVNTSNGSSGTGVKAALSSAQNRILFKPLKSLFGSKSKGNDDNNNDNDDEENEVNSKPLTWEEEEYAPDMELPEVKLQLKNRTSYSIAFIYDVDTDAINALTKLRSFGDGKRKMLREPIYQIDMRLSLGPKKKTELENDNNNNSNGNNSKVPGIKGSKQQNHPKHHQDPVLIQQYQWKLVKRRIMGTTATVEELQPNTMYEFRCRRRGWDKEWGPSIAVRTGPGVPTPPRDFNAKEVTSNTVLLTWAFPDKDNGLPVMDYVIRMKCDKSKNKYREINASAKNNNNNKGNNKTVYDEEDDANNAETYMDVVVDVAKVEAQLEADALNKGGGSLSDAATTAGSSPPPSHHQPNKKSPLLKSLHDKDNEVYRGRDRFFQVPGLNSNTVYLFELCAINRVGEGEVIKLAIRTLPPGSNDVTPWVIAVDDRSHKLYYMHPITSSVTWTLPSTGVLIDHVESFKNKKAYIRRQMHAMNVKTCKEHGLNNHYIVKYHVKRDANTLLYQSMQSLTKSSPWELQGGPIRINYIDEEGIDAGGLAKDWFTEVMRSFLISNSNSSSNNNNKSHQHQKRAHEGEEDEDESGRSKAPSYALLQETEHGVTINTQVMRLYGDESCKLLYTAFGRFVAKALVDGQTLGMKLFPLLIANLLQPPAKMTLTTTSPIVAHPVFDNAQSVAKKQAVAAKANAVAPSKDKKQQGYFNLSMLKQCESQFGNGLTWILENSVDGAELTCSTSYETFEFETKGSNQHVVAQKTYTVDLMPKGQEVDVTDENKAEYVELMTEWICRKRYEPAISYFVEGFRELIDYKYLQHFTVDELLVLISGSTTIEVKDISKGVQFAGGYDVDSQQVKWLWRMLEDYSQDMLSQFLSFVTGCPSMPIDGLNPPLQITYVIADEAAIAAAAASNNSNSSSSSSGHPQGKSGGNPTDKILPRAHTCFNQLVLPAYSTFTTLCNQFEVALQNTSNDGGFYMS